MLMICLRLLFVCAGLPFRKRVNTWYIASRLPTRNQPQNKIVETTLAFVLSYVHCCAPCKLEPISITILADSDYYSATGSRRSSDKGHSSFINFQCPLNKIHKTGLGSSAALVTAFTAAVLAHYLPSESSAIGMGDGKARVHNLAQAAHCSAQGKIGSGFDVAAAVYGTCIYRRFSPALLENLGDPGSPNFAKRLQATVEDRLSPKMWDTQIFHGAAGIPRSLKLVMCDIDCGSETSGMVKKVFAWREKNPAEAASLWAELQNENNNLVIELQRLVMEPALSSVPYEHLRDIILHIRILIRLMSEKTGVPIEPKVQTDLLDACTQLPGVVGGMVPGAGGFDAIVLVIENCSRTLNGLRSFLQNYEVDIEQGKRTSLGKVRVLEVEQEIEGIREEEYHIYGDWLPQRDIGK